jgi:putative addiction module component (TIGR02574 family)
MIAQQEIHRMPFHEKLALLEVIWTEISSEPEKIETPLWHSDILDAREEALKRGNEQVLDWDEVKKQIERATR